MKHLDLIISMFAFVGGIALTGFSYERMEVIEQPQLTLFQEHLIKGMRNYKITSAASCVGDLQIITESEQNVILTVGGNVRTSLQDVLSEVRIKARSIFNPLGQLADLSIHVNFADIQIMLQTKGIHPIEVKLTSEGLPSNLNFTTAVPGPVLIQEYEPGSFRIEYAQADIVPSPLVQNFAGFFNKSIDIKVAPIGGPSDPCHADKSSRLHLDPLVQDVARMIQGQGQLFKFFMPGAGK